MGIVAIISPPAITESESTCIIRSSAQIINFLDRYNYLLRRQPDNGREEKKIRGTLQRLRGRVIISMARNNRLKLPRETPTVPSGPLIPFS